MARGTWRIVVSPPTSRWRWTRNWCVQGHDPQLEKAVEVALDSLKKNPVNYGRRPDYPNYHKDEKP
jgi:hypothetical protein